jgi:hypothetical protein
MDCMNPTPPALECVEGPAPMPRLAPRPMPPLRLSCPLPGDGAARRYRMPLWRRYEELAGGS